MAACLASGMPAGAGRAQLPVANGHYRPGAAVRCSAGPAAGRCPSARVARPSSRHERVSKRAPRPLPPCELGRETGSAVPGTWHHGRWPDGAALLKSSGAHRGQALRQAYSVHSEVRARRVSTLPARRATTESWPVQADEGVDAWAAVAAVARTGAGHRPGRWRREAVVRIEAALARAGERVVGQLDAVLAQDLGRVLLGANQQVSGTFLRSALFTAKVLLESEHRGTP